MKFHVLFGPALLTMFAAACSDTAGAKPTTTPDGGAGDDGGTSFTSGDELDVPVPQTGRVYVKLASPPAIVTPANPKSDTTWDIAFEGLDVFTNSGPSGSAAAEAFGPLDAVSFIGDTAPSVPFLTPDKTGGAFIRWYFYDGANNHTLDSRYHVYGVKDGDKTYKVQLLSYYGNRDGAPVSALYHLRWAEVTATGPGPVQDIPDLDGTAGGTTATGDQPSECLDLGTGARTMLTQAAAETSSVWDICVRRDAVSVNGDLGGPRGVGAVDLEAAQTATETLAQVSAETADSTLPLFTGVDANALAGQTFRGDGVVSAFTGLWIAKGSSPPAPADSAWLVVGADGKTNYLIGFSAFVGATATNPGTIQMHVKAVTGASSP